MYDYIIKARYFIVVLFFFIVFIIIDSLVLNYNNFNFFIWIFWVSITSNTSKILANSLYSLSFGYLSWAIIIFFLGTFKTRYFKRKIKSIALFFPFWLSLVIYSSSIGINSFRTSWILAHLSLRFWVVGGIVFTLLLISNVILHHLNKPIHPNILYKQAIEKEKSKFKPLSKSEDYSYFLDKYQSLILISIITILGLYITISNLLGPISFRYQAFTFLLFTIFMINVIFCVNYILTLNQDLFKYKKKEEIFEFFKKSKEFVEEGNTLYTEKSFEQAIEKWKEALRNYKELLRSGIQKENMRKNIATLKSNLIDAYKGLVMNHINNAQEAYKTLDLKPSREEWYFAVKGLKVIIKLSKYSEAEISKKEIRSKIKDIEKNLKRLEIEILISDADAELKSAHILQDEKTTQALNITNEIAIKYSTVKKKAQKSKEFKNYIELIQNRILNLRVFQEKLQEKMDKLVGITPLEKRVKFDMDKLSEFEIATAIKDEIIKQILSIIREYDFIGGQIRFKVGLVNNTKYSLTNIRITFDLPKSLKWILHEPNYERKGDSIFIPKLGSKEKKAISLYLEPLNCMESSINATVSFFDAKDKPHAIPMKPKIVSVSCPIFFTESDANLARVKSLRRNLTHRDKKVFPIVHAEKASSIFSSIISILEQFDIKLISKDFFEKNNFGEAWFFGITKVKKEQLVMYVLLDGESKTLELEVSGNNEEQITAFLAEIGDRARQKLIENNIIASDEGFYDMRITVLSCLCPYCFTMISSESVEKFCNGEPIFCQNCKVHIKVD